MPNQHANVLQDHVFRNFSAIIATSGLAWDRRRCWGPMQATATVFVMRSPGANTSTRAAIPKVRELFGAMFGWEDDPDASGLSRARRRVTEAETAALWTRVHDWSLAQAAPAGGVLPGLALVAVDGTTLHLPRSSSTRRSFPIVRDALDLEQHHYPRARLVSAWDVERRLPLAWRMTSERHGERASLLALLPRLPERSVLLLDRGFPSRGVVGDILASGRQVVVRMVATQAAAWPEVAAFVDSGQTSAVVPVVVQQGRAKRTIPMRLVLRTFNRGRPHRSERRDRMVVMTSLIDAQTASDDQIIALYHQRWGIETIHREMKGIAAVERWHGTTTRLINQELHAVMCWFAIAGAIASRCEADALAAQRAAGDERPEKRVNTNLVCVAVIHVLAWQAAKGYQHEAVIEFLRLRAVGSTRAVHRYMQRKRPGRSHERTPKHPYARVIA
jgi:hypothetical protein